MNIVIPVLRVDAIDTSREFYESALEFKLDWLWRPEQGGPAFAQISRDGLLIYLSEDESAASRSAIYLYVDDVDAWHRRLLQVGVPVDKVPHDTPWRNREMVLQDPGGNKLTVCTSLSVLESRLKSK